MKKMKLIAAALCLIILTLGCLCSCKEEPKEEVLVYDSSKNYGLYWYGGKTEDDYVRSGENLSIEYFDPQKPTIIYFHGWNFAGENPYDYFIMETSNISKDNGIPAVNFADIYKEKGYNLGEFNWCSYAKDILKLFGYIWVDFEVAGSSLASLFAKEYGAFFKDYDNHVTFLGHSYGAPCAVATDYLLNKMYDEGVIKNEKCLPKRLTLADPYIGELVVNYGNKEILQKKIDYLDEEINGRMPVDLFTDALEYLNGKGAVADVYCGMPMAYSDYYMKDAEKNAAATARLQKNCVWTVLKGLQEAYGTVSIHNITNDWTMFSITRVITQNGVDFPTAALPDDRMRKLVGRQYETTRLGLNIEEEIIIDVTP